MQVVGAKARHLELADGHVDPPQLVHAEADRPKLLNCRSVGNQLGRRVPKVVTSKVYSCGAQGKLIKKKTQVDVGHRQGAGGNLSSVGSCCALGRTRRVSGPRS